MIDIGRAIVTLALAIAAPIGSDESSLWYQWGLAGVVVAYVLWRDTDRERRMAEASELQQAWIRSTLVRAVERNTSALERVADHFDAEEPGDGHDR